MNLDMLKVLNEIHGIGLTKEDYENVRIERKNRHKTGFCLVALKKEYFVYVNHSDKHIIQVKEKSRDEEGSLLVGDEILFGRIIRMKSIPDHFYVLNAWLSYDHLVINKNVVVKTKTGLNKLVYESLPNSPDIICKVDEYSHTSEERKDVTREKKEGMINQRLRAVFEFFNEEYDLPIRSDTRINIPCMIKVFQKDNQRVAILLDREDWIRKTSGMMCRTDYIQRNDFGIICLSHKDERYNYVCPGREVLTNNGCELWIENLPSVSSDDLFAYTNMQERSWNDEGVKWVLFNPEKYAEARRSIRIHRSNMETRKEKEEAERILQENISKSFKKGKVVRNGITFTPEYFEYDGIRISGDRLKEYLVKENILTLENPDFMNIYNGYVEHAIMLRRDTNYWPAAISISASEVEMNINGIKIRAVNLGKNKYSVNGYKIHKYDVEGVCKSAFEHESQKSYDEWLKLTEKYCLRTQYYLEAGFFQFRVPLRSGGLNLYNHSKDEIVVRLPIKMKERKIYTTIKGKDYKIKNQHSLMKLQRKGKEMNVELFVNQLHNSISKLSPEAIVSLIKEGRKAYEEEVLKKKKEEKEKIKRAKKFLAHAVKITKATKKGKGYLVTGVSKNIYYVEGLKVYKVNGREQKYLCIVDNKHRSKEWELIDGTAQRLLMVSQDKKTAKEIWEKGDKMDKHWIKIMEEPIEVEVW